MLQFLDLFTKAWRIYLIFDPICLKIQQKINLDIGQVTLVWLNYSCFRQVTCVLDTLFKKLSNNSYFLTINSS